MSTFSQKKGASDPLPPFGEGHLLMCALVWYLWSPPLSVLCKASLTTLASLIFNVEHFTNEI